MLNQETKRKIDSARDILVGKVPDPKAQVEQITTAMIYKFMDDMDKEAIELGGKATFFTNGFEKYSWSKLMDQKLGGQERLETYGEAVMKMSQNPHIPQLFRDVFKDAFLPYRSSETLNMFLKEINGFNYEHSEDLGDAFEYLLSILGSQGDAGQFRTPRHIIDFIVSILDPKKDETILDPACGTAGFLISAYKHILKQHKDKPLNPDEKERLMKSFVGYDISPDMVKLSKVNMYLHGFQDPKIQEYDTLTSEEHWDEMFDVILANPPFMTPKGGIRPHKRFSVQANRSEVLFVDYIKEHLRPTGRAGVIVPEGVIFKNDSAYKKLRKLLVEDGLVAVISLPSGVFNPYAGVKTSILYFDNSIAKLTNKLLFIKINNDGYDLGAQRREVKGEELTIAKNIISTFSVMVRGGDLNNDGIMAEFDSSFYNIVSKDVIIGTGDYNLSGERYREVVNNQGNKWPMVELSNICKVTSGNSAPQDKALFENGKYPFFRTSDVGSAHLSDNLKDVRDWLNEDGVSGLKLFRKGTILFPKSGASTFLNHRAIMGFDGYVSSHLAAISPNENLVYSKYVYHILCGIDAKELTSDQSYPSLKSSEIAKIKIPLPPLSIQEEIINEIDSYQKVANGAKQIVENYKPIINIDLAWPLYKISDIYIDSKLGLTRDKSMQSNDFKHPYVKMENITEGGRLDLAKIVFVEANNEEVNNLSLVDGDFIYNTRNAPNLVGKSAVYHGENNKYLFNNNILRIRFDSRVNSDFVNYYLNSAAGKNKIRSLVNGTTSVAALYWKDFSTITIPLPDIEVQNAIIKNIEVEQNCVNSARNVIRIFEVKIRKKIEEIWGE